MADQPQRPDVSPEECFDRECYLCGADKDVVPDPNFDFLFVCRTCLGHWEDHLAQIHERDEPPPSAE